MKEKEEDGIPCVADADDMIHIAESELKQLVRQDTRCICESEERVIRENRSQPHGPSMQNGFVAKTTQAGVSMNNLNLLPNDNVSENRKEGKYSGHSRLSIYDKKWNMVDFEAICQIPYSGPTSVGMCYNDNFVTSIDEFG